MNLTVFNISLLLGWLLVLCGSCLLNIGAGLAGSGALLLAITFTVARMGGVFAAAREKGND